MSIFSRQDASGSKAIKRLAQDWREGQITAKQFHSRYLELLSSQGSLTEEEVRELLRSELDKPQQQPLWWVERVLGAIGIAVLVIIVLVLVSYVLVPRAIEPLSTSLKWLTTDVTRLNTDVKSIRETLAASP